MSNALPGSGQAPDPDDRAWLERARALARRGWGHVHPNPLVGCVLVRNGRVVGEGYHERFGGPHAEVVALQGAGAEAQGATAYVTLEPCDHHGKTPPCSGALLDAGVARVVFGASDPGKESGGGAARLAAAGVEVAGPLWTAAEAFAENPAFVHATRAGTPFVALKLAVSLDGRIAAAAGAATPVSGPEARARVHALRSGFDAILVGATTARVDRPALTVRHAPMGRVPPRRLVLDGAASLATDGPLFQGLDEAPLHVFTRDDAAEDELERLEAAGAHVHPVPADAAGMLRLDALMGDCWTLGIRSILCEGGGRLAASLLSGGWVRRIHLVVAPAVLGQGGVPAFPDAAVDLSDFRPVVAPETLGRDTLITLDREEP